MTQSYLLRYTESLASRNMKSRDKVLIILGDVGDNPIGGTLADQAQRLAEIMESILGSDGVILLDRPNEAQIIQNVVLWLREESIGTIEICFIGPDHLTEASLSRSLAHRSTQGASLNKPQKPQTKHRKKTHDGSSLEEDSETLARAPENDDNNDDPQRNHPETNQNGNASHYSSANDHSNASSTSNHPKNHSHSGFDTNHKFSLETGEKTSFQPLQGDIFSKNTTIFRSNSAPINLSFLHSIFEHPGDDALLESQEVRIYLFGGYPADIHHPKHSIGVDQIGRAWGIELFAASSGETSFIKELPKWCSGGGFMARLKKKFGKTVQCADNPLFQQEVIKQGLACYLGGFCVNEVIAFQSVGIPILGLWMKRLEHNANVLPHFNPLDLNDLRYLRYMYGKFTDDAETFKKAKTTDKMMNKFCKHEVTQKFAEDFLRDPHFKYEREMIKIYEMHKLSLSRGKLLG
eukprot:CAMPEP_0115030748 /NCGR_PEP_ID=MMETSP0216-20121206/38039_1 /TAXON_ID=223996 /ORGANISM="Protocruzia adherens, Strain Boccale" /LENGTH=462 /DNA_ID=CAMNT_0002408099 /DNA_START=27 /DNA_END=1415 /DNA_ORIENTATION=+